MMGMNGVFAVGTLRLVVHSLGASGGSAIHDEDGPLKPTYANRLISVKRGP